MARLAWSGRLLTTLAGTPAALAAGVVVAYILGP
jgi:hypothetical protein